MTIPSVNSTLVNPGDENPGRRKPKLSNRASNKKPVPPERLLQQIRDVTGGWPKVVAGALVCEDGRILFVRNHTQIFSWLHKRFALRWSNGSDVISKAEFYEFCVQNSDKFDDITAHPHFPPLESMLYLPMPEFRSGGGRLDEFLCFFRFETWIDRELAKAMLLSLFWGGPPGKRPLFLITTAANAPNHGIGAGKTTLAQVFSTLCGGYISASLGEGIEGLKTRILSTEAGRLRARMILFDNVKRRKLSLAELEDLITTSWISGRRLYVGDASVANHYSYVVTINGASLGKDLASRCVTMRLQAGPNQQNWYSRVTRFVEEYRWEIIAEIGQLLQAPGIELPDAGSSRWTPWESGILSRVSHPEAVRAEIIVRQAQLDDDAATNEEFLQLLREPQRRTFNGVMPLHNPLGNNGLCSFSQSQMRDLLSIFLGKQIGDNFVKRTITSYGLTCLRQLTTSARKREWLFRYDGNPLTDEQIAAYTRQS
jgi:hypothetical protein